MSNYFNGLTPAENERLTLLAEEMAEVIQVVCKIQRHGYESMDPRHNLAISNRLFLERELGDVRNAMIMLCNAGDLSKESIHHWADVKAKTIGQFMHYQHEER
jgi:NTP pyrophosphatase (non-canonical NTP hydrolase)